MLALKCLVAEEFSSQHLFNDQLKVFSVEFRKCFSNIIMVCIDSPASATYHLKIFRNSKDISQKSLV